MIENMSIEQFYWLYKAGDVAAALCVAPSVIGVFALAVSMAVLLTSKQLNAEERKVLRVSSVVLTVCLLLIAPLVVVRKLCPTFGEVKAFVALKVGEQAVNSETAQRMIDAVLRNLESQEKGGNK